MKKTLITITIIFVCLFFLVSFARAEECQLSQRGDTQTQKCGPCKIQTRTCSCTCAKWISVFGLTFCVKWTTPCTWSASGSCGLEQSHEVGTDPCTNARTSSIDPDSKCVTEGIVLGSPYDGGTIWLRGSWFCLWNSAFTLYKGWCYNDERNKKTYDYCWDDYTVAVAYLRGCSGCKDYSKWMCMSCGTRDCDFLDTACRDYHEVNRKCSNGACYHPPCDSYTNKPYGAPCPGGICDGQGICFTPNNPPLPPSNTSETLNLCAYGTSPQAAPGLSVTLKWTYFDPDEDPQAAYAIWVDDNPNFTGAKFNYLVNRSSNAYTLNLADDQEGDWLSALSWNTTYYWKVRVKDSFGFWSNWSAVDNFTTPPHAYPYVKFDWSPKSPSAKEIVQFTDQSEVYAGTTKTSLFWTFQDGDPATSASSTPKIKFTSAGLKTVTLTVTDSTLPTGFFCLGSEPIEISPPPPEWREVIPK